MDGRLDPQAAALLEGIYKVTPENEALTVEGVRAGNARINELLVGPGEQVFRTWESTAEAECTAIPLRWFQPYEESPSLLTVYIHGGGWVNGTLDTYDTLCRALALRSRSLVMCIAYSLSPEELFPKALHEVTELIQQAKALAKSFGHHPTRLAVAGDSAGGQLIGAAIHRLIEAGATLPDKAAFLYPCLDARMSQPSWQRLANGYQLTARRMAWYWQQYAGSAEALARLAPTPEFSPLYSPHLAKFPESLVVVAEFDPLSDEGRALAAQMNDAGASAELIDVPGQIHGFLRLRKALTDPTYGSDAIMQRVGEFLQTA